DGAPCRFYRYDNLPGTPTIYINPPGNMDAGKWGGGNRGEAIRFVGENGELLVNRGNVLKTDPDASLAVKALKSGTTRLHPSMSHREDWIQAIKTGRDTICNAEIGHRTASICHLSSIALRLNRVVKWDPKKEQIIGDDQAAAMLDRPRRAPYFLGA
ncbi:MAG: hypothetical protein IKS15_01850, partial [Opitutales bacterium]|nr:hypothetical protein [Opitutales bacterium]